MILKSLYVRVVMTFIAAVILSVAIAFAASNVLFSNQIKQISEEQLIAAGKKVVRAYEQADPDGLDAFMQGVSTTPVLRILVFQSGVADSAVYDTGKPGSGSVVTDKQLKSVLKGGIYRGSVAAFDDGAKGGPDRPLVGLPFLKNGRAYALFITPDFSDYFEDIQKLLHTAFLIVLASGSFLVLIAARFIVNPLKRLAEAMKRMARGDFSIRLHTRRKDEIGVLTNNFNHMVKELGMLDRMRQDFVANVSHEIQSPLTSISGFTKALKQKKMDEERRLQLLTIIEEESERLSRLSENLLQLSSLQYEHHPHRPRRYRLDEQLRQVIIATEPLWSAKRLEIQIELEPIAIEADEDKLKQVWINLLGNAVKYTPEGGTVRIEAKEKSGRAVIAVEDSGCGIPEEERGDIFKPFYRVDKSRDRSTGGSGLGLSIVKRIVDIHGGDIEVSGVAGQGAIFTVTLPITSGD